MKPRMNASLRKMSPEHLTEQLKAVKLTTGKKKPTKLDANLSSLASELLIKITRHLETAQSIAHLALTCKYLENFVHRYAWETFARTRFPTMTIGDSKDLASCMSWRDITKVLTRHSMIWERKAFNAFALDPSFWLMENDKAMLRSLSTSTGATSSTLSNAEIKAKKESLTQRIRRRNREVGPRRPWLNNRDSARSQTIGSQTRVDCKVKFSGSANDSEEIMAIGAGADLHVRLRKTSSRGHPSDEIVATFQGFEFPERFLQGRDDITTVKIVSWNGMEKPHKSTSSLSCEVIVGRSSGALQKINIDFMKPLSRSHNVTNFRSNETFEIPISITSADIHENLLAASTKRSVMLYDVNSMVLNTAPISEVPTTASQQTWCTNFLSVNRLAIGVGSCKDPLEIYDIDETGQVVKNNSHIPFPSTTSVFAIQPLCKTSTAAGSLPGNVFLTGSHDGWCRLVDLRDQDGIVTNYQDHIENFPYYSLALIGQERFIAGSSQESRLTVYDLRMGNKAYHYTDALPCLPRSPFPNPPRLPPASANTRATCFQDMESSAFLRCRFHEEAIKRVYDPNFRIDLGPKETWKTSPVYSLCSPSHLYPHIYAGVQDHVLELRLDGGSEANAANRQESLRRRKTSKEYLTYPFKENQFLLGMTEVPEEASARAYVPLQRGLDSSPVCIPYAYRDLDQDAEHRHRLDPQWHLEKDHWNFKE